MKIVCSYCKKKMGHKDPFNDASLTHAICTDCFRHFEEQIDGLPLDRYLDKFETPVIIVNADSRVVASNKMAEAITGKPQRKVLGLLGGEAMECAFARLPEGCGETVHCETCTIRRTVMAAMESGKSQLHLPVKLEQVDKMVEMVISTYKIDELVRIVIENVN